MSRIDDIKNRLPAFWRSDEESRTHGLMQAISDELDAFSTEKDNLRLSIQIDTAVGQELDDIGSLFRLSRNPNENDTAYRTRIKAFFNSFTGGGTHQAIKNAVSSGTGIPISQFTTTDVFDLKFRLNATLIGPQIAFQDEIRDITFDAKAAGIFPLFKWTIVPQETISVTDTVTLIGTGLGNFFIIDVSLIDGADLIQ